MGLRGLFGSRTKLFGPPSQLSSYCRWITFSFSIHSATHHRRHAASSHHSCDDPTLPSLLCGRLFSQCDDGGLTSLTLSNQEQEEHACWLDFSKPRKKLKRSSPVAACACNVLPHWGQSAARCVCTIGSSDKVAATMADISIWFMIDKYRTFCATCSTGHHEDQYSFSVFAR